MIRVLIVDDHAVVRRGLADLLTASGDIAVVGSLEDGSGAAAAVVELEPDIVLMDLSMPGMDGIEATRAVLAARPETKVVVLTSFSDSARILGALEAGAVGYLLKDTEPDVITRAIRDAAVGGVPLSPQAARALLPGNRPAGNATADALTPREREVLSLVALGLANKSVARRLAISEKTVKAHLTRVFTVLGVSDRTSAALWAQRHGLV
ncbi:MAG: response regulator transcription factor [Frankiales bacterium]|nr:response regulator transcription factor [Frankiales bacterium]